MDKQNDVEYISFLAIPLSVLIVLYIVIQDKVISSPAYWFLPLTSLFALLLLKLDSKLNIFIIVISLGLTILLPVLRYYWLAFIETRNIFYRIFNNSQKLIAKNTLIRLLPLFVLIGLLVFFNSFISNSVYSYVVRNGLLFIPGVYNINLAKATNIKYYGFEDEGFMIKEGVSVYDDASEMCVANTSNTILRYVSINNIRCDAKAAVDELHKDFKKNFIDEIDDISDEAKQKASEPGGDVIKFLFGGKDPRVYKTLEDLNPAFRVPKCSRFYHWITRTGNCIKKLVLKPVSQSYSNVRHDFEQRVRNDVARINADNENAINELTIYTKEQMEVDLNKRALAAKIQIDNSTDNLIVVQFLWCVITWAWIVLLVLKVILIVFVRIIYSPMYGDVPLTFQDFRTYLARKKLIEPQSLIHAKDITSEANQEGFALKADNKTWFSCKSFWLIDERFKAKTKNVSKAKIAFPNPANLIIRRLFSASYKCDELLNDEGLTWEADNKKYRFVKITLEQEQEICLRLNNLICFNDGIQFHNKFSIVAAMHFQHSMFFTVATGPGELVLQNKGGAATLIPEHQIKMQEGEKSLQPIHLVAFDPMGFYQCRANPGIIGFYTRGSDVRVMGDKTRCIKQTSQENIFNRLTILIKRIFILLFPL